MIPKFFPHLVRSAPLSTKQIVITFLQCHTGKSNFIDAETRIDKFGILVVKIVVLENLTPPNDSMFLLAAEYVSMSTK